MAGAGKAQSKAAALLPGAAENRNGDGLGCHDGTNRVGSTASSPLPLVGRGRGWGALCGAPLCLHLSTPHPDPPPQGGREKKRSIAENRAAFIGSLAEAEGSIA